MIEIENPSNSTPSIVYYTLYESNGVKLYDSYLIVIGPTLIIAGIVVIIYERIVMRK